MPQPDARARSSPPSHAAPLAITLGLVALASMGTGAVTNGVYFITKSLYGFDRFQNWGLALAASVAYIVGAVSVGRLTRAIKRKRALTTRRVLAVLLAAMGMACFFPALVRVPLAVWFFHAGYHLLAGMFWPMVESYVSGGRRGAGLRRATGLFNVTWATTLPLAYWLMAPFLPERTGDGGALPMGPFIVLIGLGVVHLGGLVFIALLTPDPGRHGDAGIEEPAGQRELYGRLLSCFRVALIASYVLLSAVTPALPDWTAELGIPDVWRTPAASVWMAVRVGVFALLMWWHGWHGRFRTLIWSIGAMVVGTATTFLAGDVATLLIGLALLGVGSGATYTAAIYYAMAHGEAEIDAGGTHETMIGLGYLSGPVFGLMAAGFVHASGVVEGARAERTDQVALAIVGLAALVLIAIVVRLAVGRRERG